MSQHPFFEIHKGLPREGPGNNASTRKAFQLLKGLPSQPQILDVGCGPGMQTLELASLAGGTITAVDRHEPFLQQLNQKKAELGLTDKIKTVQGDMFALPFAEQSMDLIWSEGAIYIIGFERGLREWRKLLRPNGYMVVSELTWLTEERPERIEAFWMEHYPAIQRAEANQKMVEQAGYRLLHQFPLPEAGWWEYYKPMQERIHMLREQYAGQIDMQQGLDEAQGEIELYREFGAYYGYTFYILQRREET
ncbi:class I SAM-dependent methyltransferase [Brevibacillus nitrificans]|uniref:class I SAM-dependent methyltransferase n=1 Tax=Brevibacillus nitrificans TaxID=651560 RepID=UPI002865713A|nr:class I SAM-dependent methyltransferase [Brevibacillus nitrificans]MDR7316508.1 ubiquinone/menaquinone biosynthesis C-methylase UbiE [Brevibacillus nitrificans]